jgi:hypothetical protein
MEAFYRISLTSGLQHCRHVHVPEPGTHQNFKDDQDIESAVRPCVPVPLSSFFDAKQVLSALIAGVAMLEADTGGKKQAKQLVLLTDGESATAWEEDDVARLVTKMNDYGVELTVM